MLQGYVMNHLFKSTIKTWVFPTDLTGLVFRTHIEIFPCRIAQWFRQKSKNYVGMIFLHRNQWYIPIMGSVPIKMPAKLVPMFNDALDKWLLDNWGEDDYDGLLNSPLKDNHEKFDYERFLNLRRKAMGEDKDLV